MIVPIAALIDESSVGAQVFIQVGSWRRGSIKIGRERHSARVCAKLILSAGSRRKTKTEKESQDDSGHAMRPSVGQPGYLRIVIGCDCKWGGTFGCICTRCHVPAPSLPVVTNVALSGSW